MSKKFFKNTVKPSKNNRNLQLRVLYKKVGESPKIKIINDIENFKKAIVLDKLDIIPYKQVFIVCNNQKHKMQMPINVFFSLFHIAGDLIVVDIDKSKREFKSLTQDQLLYYSKDLINREPNTANNGCNAKNKIAKKENYTPYERELETDVTQKSNFEKSVINILVNIELILANLLKNNDYGDDENDE